MLKKKNPKKMHADLIKYQVENCPALPGRNLISTCNRRVKSVSAGRVECAFHIMKTNENKSNKYGYKQNKKWTKDVDQIYIQQESISKARN